jgi:hypothetical protein
MGNTNSYNKFLNKINNDNIFIVNNFKKYIFSNNSYKSIKEYKKLFLVIELDSILFFSKKHKLKLKINLKDITLWKNNYNLNLFLLYYNSNKLIIFNNNDIHNISKIIYNNAQKLSNSNINFTNDDSINEELSESSSNNESTESLPN